MTKKSIAAFIEDLFKGDLSIYDENYKKLSKTRIVEDFNSLLCWSSDKNKLGPIGIRLSHDYRFTLAILACLKSGRPFVPLSPDWPEKRIHQVAKISSCCEILDDDLYMAVQKSKDETAFTTLPYSSDGAAYILFTSGSTGVPKGVEITRKSYCHFLNWVNDEFTGINSEMKLLNATQFTFDVSLMEIALLITKSLHYYPSNMKGSPLVMAKEISDLGINVSVTVPNNFNLFLNDRVFNELNFSSLEYVILAGSRFPVNLWHELKSKLPSTNVYNCYGPTEATIYCLFKKMTFDVVADISKETVSIGRPIEGLSAKIQGGELIISGPQVMKGYVGDSQKTQEVMFDDQGVSFYKTGDLSFVNKEGDFFITGRNDDTVKVSGQRVNLSDIDGHILSLSEVQECATIAVPDSTTDYALVSFIVPTSERPTSKDFKRALKDILISSQRPKKIILRQELPLGSSGKIDKKALKASYLEK